MIKNYFRLFVAAFLLTLGMNVAAQTLTDQAVTVTWAFSDGTDEQVATFGPDGSDAYFKSSYFTYGSNLANVGLKSVDELIQTCFQPGSQDSGPTTGNAIDFKFTVRDGLTFTPTKVSFTTTRYGTDGGLIDVQWIGSDGAVNTLATGVVPARNNRTPNRTDAAFEVTDATASDGECTLHINLYNLGNTKQVGFCNIVIEGVLNGSVAGSVTLTDFAGIATFPFTEGTEDQSATISPDEAADYFKSTYFTYGSELTLWGVKTKNDLLQTAFDPTVNSSAAAPANAVDFIIVPKTGLTFTPTKVSVKATRHGTGGGLIDLSWLNSDGTSVSIATGIKPERDNTDPFHTAISQEVVGATASDDACGLRVNIYSLAPGKQIGLFDVVIEGVINGSVLNITQYTLAVQVSPEGAGEVSVSPIGDIFDEGDVVTLSQERGFGYQFVNWTNAAGEVISTEETVDVTMTADTVITANYEPITTYSLTYSAAGGANDYMINVAPEPHVIDGKNMYEAGTSVSLTATTNPILAFTNWSNGETSAAINLTMDQDQEIVANYAAIDFIVGWDFIQAGGNGRKADFAAADNDDVTLVLRNEAGETSGWLDKSLVGGGGYEGRNCAVNWRNNAPLGTYYWQTRVNATAFTDIKVKSAMLYNYNAYTKQNVEYSLDGETWQLIGVVELAGAKNWADTEFSLPAEANNQPAVYIRWKSDTTSPIDGTESANDGISLGDIYITGTESYVDDGTAPVLVSTVPTEGSEGASANGRVILTFDEKVKVAEGAVATLGDQQLTPSVSGQTVIFEYKGLEYSTPYTFTLPGGSVSDLTDNTIAEDIVINFSTRTRPTIAKALYDFVVPDDGTFSEAIVAANSRADKNVRYRIFVKQGHYVIPASETETITGSDGVAYPSPITRVTAPNISIIGEDMDNTSIVNTLPDVEIAGAYGPANPLEGLHNNQTIDLNSNATETYMQDITIRSGMKDSRGRNGALEDASNKTICKDVALYGYQDTYLSNNGNGRFYFEGGVLRGRTDYLCGKGDVYYNEVELLVCESGGYICAPSQPKQYGYVFKGCTITAEKDGIDGNFTLGRPWGNGTPIALYIDTRMEAMPSADGWNEMSGGWPARFAEYNSTTATGTVIDLSNRKKTFGDGHENNPVLSAAEAAQMTIANVMGADDDWDPTEATEQASAPRNVVIAENVLTWDASDYVLLWAVCKDGKVIGFTTEPTYTVDDTTAEYSVRAANEMGGLGDATVALTDTQVGINCIDGTNAANKVVSTAYYNVNGIKTNKAAKGINVKVVTYMDGTVVTSKVVK